MFIAIYILFYFEYSPASTKGHIEKNQMYQKKQKWNQSIMT